jgi:proton-translocating NADH-quinone oxidoreductase chain N
MDATTNFLIFLAFPLCASPIVYIIGRLYARADSSQKGMNPAKWLALMALLGSATFLFFTGKGVFETGQALYYTLGEVVLRFDGVSLLLAIIALALGILVTIYSFAYIDHEEGEEKFYALLIAMVGAISGLGCAVDLFNLWVWFELMAVTSILLVAFYRNRPGSLEAGVKYLVQSAVGSIFVMLGIALVFLQVGSLNLESIRTTVSEPSPLLLLGGALLIIGFGVKTAIVPMHTWLPDAHSQAPSGISAMLSGIVIEAGLIALLRAIGGLALGGTRWGYLLIGFSVLNMVVGNLMALRQREVKRILAYSSISQVGYMLLGYGMMISFNSYLGGIGASFHMVTHAIMKGLAFLAAGALLYCLRIANGDHGQLTVDDLNGASKKYPLTAFALSLALLALGGLPPLAGFMSKWQIFLAGAVTKNAWIIALVVFAGLNSVLSLGYYAPLVNRMYRKTPSEIIEHGKPVSIWMYIPMMILSLMVVALGVLPSLMYWLTIPALSSLYMFFAK